MKRWAEISIIAAAISFILGVISRAITKCIWGIPARSFVLFAVVCLSFAVALILLAMLNSMEKK